MINSIIKNIVGGTMKNMGNLMKQAQVMQQKITSLKKELEQREIESSAGGGAVKVKINGKQEILELTIDPELFKEGDVSEVEYIVKTAVNSAIKESQDMVNNAMSKVTGGMNIPGLF